MLVFKAFLHFFCGVDWTILGMTGKVFDEIAVSGFLRIGRRIHFPDANTGYLVGDGIILKTTDAGSTWTSLSFGVTLSSVYFTDVNTGYAVGGNGAIIKTSNGGGLVGMDEIQEPVNNLSIFPNPSNNNINIKTTIEGCLSIQNMEGQQLLKQRITVSTFNIDVSTLPHGVYVIKVVGNKGLQVGKFLKQ